MFQGQFCSIAFTFVDEGIFNIDIYIDYNNKIDDIRKGMVLINLQNENVAIRY